MKERAILDNKKIESGVAYGALAILIAIVVFSVLMSRVDTTEMVQFTEKKVSLGGMKGAIFKEMRRIQAEHPDQVAGYFPFEASLPQTAINLNGLLVSRHETTTLQYLFFLSMLRQESNIPEFHPATPEGNKHRPLSLGDMKFNDRQQPVVGVDWFNAYAFCKTAGMRLPTQLEFANLMAAEMRSREVTEFDIPTKTILVESEETKIQKAVDDKPVNKKAAGEKTNEETKGFETKLVEVLIPNEIKGYMPINGGLDNIIGNVFEWVAEAPVNEAEKGRNLGPFQFMGYSYREFPDTSDRDLFIAWKRQSVDPDSERNDLGFRCVYELPDSHWQTLAAKSFENEQFACWDSRSLLNSMSAGDKGAIRNNLLPKELCRYKGARTQTNGQTQSQLLEVSEATAKNGYLDTLTMLKDKPMAFTEQLLGNDPQEVALAAFWLDKQEVSVAQFNEFLQLPTLLRGLYAHPAQPEKVLDNMTMSKDAESEAVVNVNWWQAFAYCQWQNKRLPYSKELEAAIGGETNNIYSWGNSYSAEKPDITKEEVSGLSRNVSEWSSTLIASTRLAVVKGGNRFFDAQIYGRSYAELVFDRNTLSEAVGFRCAADF